MTGSPGVSWGEAARMLARCWAVLGLMCAVLSVVGESTSLLFAPVVMMLTQWAVTRHRHWVAGGTATVVGIIVGGTAVDGLRPHLDRLVADTLSTAAAVLFSLVAFTLASRTRGRVRVL
ncbi:hypothetical protein ACFXJ5_07240 [Streptomyces sp. NPDC059373]